MSWLIGWLFVSVAGAGTFWALTRISCIAVDDEGRPRPRPEPGTIELRVPAAARPSRPA